MLNGRFRYIRYSDAAWINKLGHFDEHHRTVTLRSVTATGYTVKNCQSEKSASSLTYRETERKWIKRWLKYHKAWAENQFYFRPGFCRRAYSPTFCKMYVTFWPGQIVVASMYFDVAYRHCSSRLHRLRMTYTPVLTLTYFDVCYGLAGGCGITLWLLHQTRNESVTFQMWCRWLPLATDRNATLVRRQCHKCRKYRSALSD